MTFGEIYEENDYRAYENRFDHDPVILAVEKVFYLKSAFERQGLLDG